MPFHGPSPMRRIAVAAILAVILIAVVLHGIAAPAGVPLTPGGAGSPYAGRPPSPFPAGTDIPIEDVWQGTGVSFGPEAAFLVVQTQAEWEALWGRAEGPGAPPQVDFAQRTVLVAIAGERPSGGYSIHVTRATATDGGVRVDVQTDVPGAGCAAITVITYPVHMASIPKVSGPVAFMDQRVTYTCA